MGFIGVQSLFLSLRLSQYLRHHGLCGRTDRLSFRVTLPVIDYKDIYPFIQNLSFDNHGDDDDGQVVVGNGGQEFMDYCVYGKPFQVLAKYKPPFNPIGQGAYGFVW